MLVFLNGQFVPEEQAVVSVFDRGFLYGDGLFETMRVVNGKPFRWDQHLHRLDCVRHYLLGAFRGMAVQEFRRPRSFPRYRVTAEWVVQHVIQHEGEHRGQIQSLRSLAEGALDAR